MKTVPVEMTTVDAGTGEVVEKKTVGFGLMPPRGDVCQTCARKHEPEEPHDATTLYYQYAFYGEHGRWPDWRDAMAHCSDDVRALWTEELIARGVDVHAVPPDPDGDAA